MRLRLAAATATVAGLLFVAYGQDGAETARPGLGAIAAKMLRSDDPAVPWQEREDLLRQLDDQYGAVRAEVLSVLSVERETERRLRFGSQLHTAILAARTWRIVEARPHLRRIVACRLDPSTVPVGRKLQAADFYPAAQALASLPVRVEDLFVGVTDEELPIVGWVLAESQGRESAMALLRQILVGGRIDGPKGSKAVDLLQATQRVHELLPPIGK